MSDKKDRVFYGWWIVVASFFIAMCMGGVIFYGFTAFFEPIMDELGWSYTQVSLAASLRGLEMGLLAPLMGMFVDRWGARWVIMGGVAIAAVGLFLLSATTSLVMFYGAFVLIAVGMSASTATVLMTAVANWFRRRIGIASGVALSGFGFSGLLVPVIVTLISVYEWRTALVILAVSMLVLVLPLSLLFRQGPERYGYSPDGQEEPVAYDSGLDIPKGGEVSVSVQRAIKSGTFWRLASSFTYHMLVMSATITHVMPYLGSIGLDRSLSGLVAAGMPLMSIGGRLGLGWLGDKTDRRLVAVANFAMMGFGLLCLGYASTLGTHLLVPFLILFGIGYGGGNALRAALVREYFGRSSFGGIFGLTMGVGAVGAIAGPALAGWTYDNLGSYQIIWLVFAGLAIAAVISVSTISPVSKGQDVT